MKRTLTGIAAASMVLGTMAPAALASTSSSPYTWSTRTIEQSGVAISGLGSVPGFTYQGSYYISVYDVQYLLQKLGINAQWYGNTLNITGVKIDTSKLPTNTPSNANAFINVNGQQVFKGLHFQLTPPGGKFATSFMQVYDLQQVLDAIGIDASGYNGTAGTWNIVPPAANTSGPSFSTVTASGNQVGTGTSTSPATSTNGGAVTLTTTLSNNGAAAPNTAVNVTVAGGSSQPVLEANGTYVTPTPSGSDWTFTANTDSNGKLAISVVGTGTYTVTLTDANDSSVTTTGYVAFMGANGLLTPAGTSGSPYAANISTTSNTAAGVVAVTYTLPPNSTTGAVQSDEPVYFHLTTPDGAFFSTASGTNLGVGSDYSTYTNAQGQATVYINNYTAGTTANPSVELSASFGSTAYNSGSSTSTYIAYSNPAAPATSAALNNIAASAFGVAGASTSSPSSVTGVPVSKAVYFAPVDANGNPYGPTDGNITYTLSASNGATIASLDFLSGTTWTTDTLAAPLSGDSNLTLQYVLNSNNQYNVYINGIQYGSYATTSPAFGATLAAGATTGSNSTLTVTSGSVNATGGIVFSGSGAVNVSSFSPVVGSLKNGNGVTQTETFKVVDASGNPVANTSVKLVLPNSSSLAGEWITAVNGKQLSEPYGANGASVYTPISLDQTGDGATYDVGIPGLVNWNHLSPTTLWVTTDANGDVSLTFQNGDVWYATSNSNATNTEDSAHNVSGYNLYAFTPSAAANEGVLTLAGGTTAPTVTYTSTTAGGTAPTATQVGEIDS